MGKALMVSSHILSELAEMCTSIGIIERGKLLYAGSIADAYSKTREAYGVAGERITVRLEASGAPAAAVMPIIGRDERIATIALEEATGTLTITIRPGDHGRHFLVEVLIASGARIASMSPDEIKLEDAFLKLTTGALQ